MAVDQAQLKRIAVQSLQADQLMGVDFVPLARQVGSDSVDTRADSGTDTGTNLTPAPGDPVESHAQPGNKADALVVLRERHDRECPHCTAATAHTQTVFGEGNPDADLMFVGEAPGAAEDQTGRPFVGRAGRKLNEIIQAMGLSRDDVYIANVLKSRPPNNRTPQPDEVSRCSPYLAEQIRLIAPKVIVTLGGPATKLLLNTDVGITRLRGTWAAWRGGIHGGDPIEMPVMPTFHPAYLLRNYTRETREKVWSDMQQVMTRLRHARHA